MGKHLPTLLLVFFFSQIFHAQQASNDTIPAIKAEMGVNEYGALTYILPIEVFKGVNDFQPNIALQYISQSGNGMAGWGWNISGVSTIMQGGQSKEVDGITIGAQYNPADPYYLDGQRLLKTGPTTFVTQRYSKIKVEFEPDTYSFTVQYTDGRIAKYKELSPGQFYVTAISDAHQNEIHYSYDVQHLTTYLRSISYGGTDPDNDIFKIDFFYKNRSLPAIIYRHGASYLNTRILSRIDVKSGFLSSSNGLYRRYILNHTNVLDNTVEQLTKVELQNETGSALKPLSFAYGQASGSITISSESGPILRPSVNLKSMGSVAFGDFHGSGKPYPLYEVEYSDSKYKIWSPKTGVVAINDKSKKLMAGKALKDGKIPDYDVLLELHTDYSDNTTDHITVDVRDINGPPPTSRTWAFPAITVENTFVDTLSLSGQPLYIDMGNEEGKKKYIMDKFSRDKRNRKVIAGDFNNDGLTELLIFQPKGAFGASNLFYYSEIGRLGNSASLIPLQMWTDFTLYPNSKAYMLEFNGDGIPEIALVDQHGRLMILKVNLQFNTIEKVYEITIPNFTEHTPLVLGDYNGDGLTDFITPQKVYSIEGSSPTDQIRAMESEPLLWWQFIATGTSFISTSKDYTANSLAYIRPSQKNITEIAGSAWQKLWSIKEEYLFSEYAMSTVMAADINSDGKSDLISIKKFGKAKYETNLWDTHVENVTVFHNYVPTTANKIIVHITGSDQNGGTTLTNSPRSVSIANLMISPLSFMNCVPDLNFLNRYKNEILFHDPLTQSQTVIKIADDSFNAQRIVMVDNGSPIVQRIEYRPMVEMNNSETEEVYTTVNPNLPYPYYLHKNNGGTYLVHKIHTHFDDKILTREYRYQNGIQHLNGKGFLGFQKTFTSDSYESIEEDGFYRLKNLFKGIFWTIKTYDPTLENYLTSTSYGSLNPNSVFTRTTHTNTRYDKGGNRYLILPNLQKTVDYLKDIVITKTFLYDTEGDLLLKQISSNFNNIGSSIEKFTYASEFTQGSHYFFGKISQMETSTFKDGLVFTTRYEQDYNTDGTVLQSRKYGNGTPAIITDYTYFPFGSVKTESMSTTDVAAPLLTSYEYDITKRFVWKTVTPDALEKITNYDVPGRLVSEISGLGQTTSYKHDQWGNIKQITNFLGLKTFVTRQPGLPGNTGSYSIHVKEEGGSEKVTTYDKFDRQIAEQMKGLNDRWIYLKVEYDLYGKKTRVSEPHFEGDAVRWNTTEYDELGRPTKQTAYNGTTAITCYDGLKVSVEDGHKKVTKLMDAMGHNIMHEDAGGTIRYKYYPNGSLREVDYEGIVTRIAIDGWGNKTRLEDPSAGVYNYEYDNFSRLRKGTNPKGGVTTYNYDEIGRLSTENTLSNAENTTIQKSYLYDSESKLLKSISGQYNGKDYIYSTIYDDKYRVKEIKEETPELLYSKITSYDNLGRVQIEELKTTVKSLNHTSTSQVKNVYDGNGVLFKQIDNQNSKLIWQLNASNAKGLNEEIMFGNGYKLTTTYNSTTDLLENIKHASSTATILNIDYNYSPQRGILLSRNNIVFGKSETYQYDDLDRLLSETVNDSIAHQYTYDKRGRMSFSSDLGKYSYEEQNYRLKKINFNERGSGLRADRGFSAINYNSFKQPVEILLEGKDKVNYEYSILKTRSAAHWGNLDGTQPDQAASKYYSSDGAIEVIREGNITKLITYVDGSPYDANYIKIDLLSGGTVTSQDNYFLHRDNQATILGITKADVQGTVVERRYFDAWGNLKELLVADNDTVKKASVMGWHPELLLDRGYTGHEHLKTVGLIHMNGRIYDPQLRRFLSPDNYVQDPENTQNYNRFGYVWNNPLLYVDQNGEIGVLASIGIIVAAAIITNGINNSINDIPFWYGSAKAGTMAAISAVISYGIGALTTTYFNSTLGQTLFRAGMHGVTQGIMSAAYGESFWSGFAAGAVSSLVSSVISGIVINSNVSDGIVSSGLQNAAIIAAGGLSGGLSSAIAGGNFWVGAIQGVIVSGMNHVTHLIQEPKVDINTEIAKEIVKKYHYGTVEEIKNWLDRHPLVEVDGILKFKGIDELSIDINTRKITKAVNGAAKFAGNTVAKLPANLLLKQAFGGAAKFALWDGKLAKIPQPEDKMRRLILIDTARRSLMQYMFMPEGPIQTPSMLNNMSPYAGFSPYQLYYQAR